MGRVDGRGGVSGSAGGGFSGTAGRAVWTRVSPAPGQVLDLLHARVMADFAPHVHEPFAIGACTEGTEAIGYRGGVHYSSPGSVVILEPGEPHTGGPAGAAGFVYRVMYPSADLLADGAGRPPRFPRPVVTDPALALELRRVHALLSQGAEPLEAESRLAALLGELVRRHSAPASPAAPPAGPQPGAGRRGDRVRGPGPPDALVPPGRRDHSRCLPQQRSRQRPAVRVMLAAAGPADPAGWPAPVAGAGRHDLPVPDGGLGRRRAGGRKAGWR